MRRLLLSLLLLLGAIGVGAPMHAAPPAPVASAGMGGHCGGGHADCARDCLGCALEPGETTHHAPHLLPPDQTHLAFLPVAPRSRAIGRDPPPPRRG